ncbi:related to Spherulin 4 precursor [Ustilago sp. UG-2017b]|nr:related to Spherulin 4 precursor [Ustilago sp. UG-2017b]
MVPSKSGCMSFPTGWTSLLVLITMFASLLQTVTGTSTSTSKKVSQQSIDTTTPRILVPLYIYPLPNAWDPLYTALRNNPTVAFTVVVNPNSGPGTGKAPNSDYAAAIKRLRAIAGANQILELVGYVRTDYGKRAEAEVKADVAKYVGWADGVKLDGIFFDEVGTQSKWLKLYTNYTDAVKGSKWASTTKAYSSAHKAYVAKSKQKASKRLHRSAITILNPGTWPESSRFFDIADHVIIYEDKLSNFNYTEYKQKTASKKNAGRAFQRSYIFYNVDPNNATTKDGKKFTMNSLVKASVNGLNAKGGLFITNLDIGSIDVYASFSSVWQRFVKSVASLSS